MTKLASWRGMMPYGKETCAVSRIILQSHATVFQSKQLFSVRERWIAQSFCGLTTHCVTDFEATVGNQHQHRYIWPLSVLNTVNDHHLESSITFYSLWKHYTFTPNLFYFVAYSVLTHTYLYPLCINWCTWHIQFIN